ncbi:MAG: Undecaprenyl-diphosphatase [Lentisphaerae bacterium ADurb.BinA184]|nr:MAG: Undecaprenyl-diphosphatase [Lentisphaerae bacterium ADurb.BinA184]
MVTIVGGVLADLPLVQAAEFSFLLALPTLGMATAYEAVGSRGELLAYVGPAELTVGLVVSGVVAALSVRGLVRWLTGHGLWPFGVYRIGLAAVVLWLLGR